jgi:hypothetical protein
MVCFTVTKPVCFLSSAMFRARRWLSECRLLGRSLSPVWCFGSDIDTIVPLSLVAIVPAISFVRTGLGRGGGSLGHGVGRLAADPVCAGIVTHACSTGGLLVSTTVPLRRVERCRHEQAHQLPRPTGGHPARRLGAEARRAAAKRVRTGRGGAHKLNSTMTVECRVSSVLGQSLGAVGWRGRGCGWLLPGPCLAAKQILLMGPHAAVSELVLHTR